MALSNELISEFVKATKDDSKQTKESTVYGTIVEYEGSKYVRLDGSDLLTPISSTTNVKDSERVTVLIKNHSAIVTGNLSSPSARTTEVEEVDNKISKLNVDKLSAEQADLKYANIDFANIGTAAMEYFYATSGLIKNVVVENGTVTGELVGVTIKGDLIEGNTVVADKLVIKGDDGLYYKLNTDGMSVEAQQTEYNSLNGSVILAKSITATKISVDDLVAFDATIGGFNITDSSIYSGAKTSVDNATRGIYLDNTGQVAFGDANNFLKFFKDTDGLYKLSISADVICLSSGKNVGSAISDLENKIITYVQFAEPTGALNVGDIWVKTQAGVTWDALKDATWEKNGDSLWGELGYSEEPVTYVWNGSKWILTVDYNVVNDTSKAVSTIEKRANAIELRVEEVAEATPDELKNSAVTIDIEGVSVTGGKIDIKANSSLNLESGGTVKISAGNGDESYINFGEAFSASSSGCTASVGSFESLYSGGKKVITEDEIPLKMIISATEPNANGIIWICPSSTSSVEYSAPTGADRNKFFYNTTQTIALSPSVSDVLPNSTYKYVVRFSVYLINDGANENNITFNVSASKSSNPNSIITFPTYTLAVIKAWEQVDISMTVNASVNLCDTNDPINISISATNLSSNRLCLQRNTLVALTVADQNASSSVQACSVYYKP